MKSPDVFLPGAPQPKKAEINFALEDLILSASGWRKIFTGDGEEESFSTSLSPPDQIIVAAMALAFVSTLPAGSTLAVATDSRPTGPAIADIMIRVFLGAGLRVRYSGITAVPELLSAVQTDNNIEGFAYISASHNPVGHNGLKFGYADGSVAGGAESEMLISTFRRIIESATCAEIGIAVRAAEDKDVAAAYSKSTEWKETTYNHYLSFTQMLCEGGREAGVLESLRQAALEKPLGIVAELNGSARGTTIDSTFFAKIGVDVEILNGTPGQIVHRIVPEGASLDLCKTTLAQKHVVDQKFFAGYVPDNDGDRGNLVYVDSEGNAKVLEAQEVFALSCLSELASLAYTKAKSGGDVRLANTVVVANGPTSMRIDVIAAAFGASVQRAEVGEANVVNLARELRESGKIVRFLGEGSNGGNITHPATCRDPLNTLLSVCKLMLLRGNDEMPGLFELWCKASGQSDKFCKEYTLENIIATLPKYTTTSAYESRAIMDITTTDHGALKAAYEQLLPSAWPEIAGYLADTLGVEGWKIVNYEGIKTSYGIGNRDLSGPQKGGLKVSLLNSESRPLGYFWMRGSGTEPVFRILVDVPGDVPEAEEKLLTWHRKLIEQADAAT